MRTALATVVVLSLVAVGCNQEALSTSAALARSDATLEATLHKYVIEFLRRNPTVNTYLGGAGLDPSLERVDGTLRDYSSAALELEDRWLGDTARAIEGIDAVTLSPGSRIDREVALAQIRFMLHQHRERRYAQRALDTYVGEPFRALDWQVQGMTQTGSQTYGTAAEWIRVVERLRAIPTFLATARDQLRSGVRAGNTPDPRMLRRDGIDTTEANARYFASTLPKMASERVAGARRVELLEDIGAASQQAAEAYESLKAFVTETYFRDFSATVLKPLFDNDRFAIGDAEYDWAIRNNFRLSTSAAQLYDAAWPIVETTRRDMVLLACEIAIRRQWINNRACSISPQHAGPIPRFESSVVQDVFDRLSKEYPKSDAEMIAWYRDAAFRLVDYGRRAQLFDVPADYKLEVTETPPPLEASIDGAAYYPAPPFKNSGVGRFYVTPTHENPAALMSNNRAALADLAAHEGFPGHDWHFKVMTVNRSRISPVRWLTPGAVEDSSSMWEDSMAAEGWGLYAESLPAEPQPGAPNGFYSPEERLYQLQGQLYRDLRVRIDTGIHTGRMSYGEATTLFSEVVDFLPGSCTAAAPKSEQKRASCDGAERAIFRYSKWPTQAITYRLGKDQILALRDEARALLGNRFSAKAFHLAFMRQGTIPAGYFHDALLRELREPK